MEHKKKKRRSENWHQKEKDLLRKLIHKSAHILENKSLKTTVNYEKAKEWKNVIKKFNAITGKNRSDSDIKLSWKRMKMADKANLSQTGGGQKQLEPEESSGVFSIAPHDFVIEINDINDSFAVQTLRNDNISKTNNDDTEAGAGITFFDVNKEIPKTITVTSELETEIAAQVEPLHEISKCTSPVVRKSIEEGNIDFKKRQLEMLEEEHQYNIKIAKLKIKKLELEITILENHRETKYKQYVKKRKT